VQEEKPPQPKSEPLAGENAHKEDASKDQLAKMLETMPSKSLSDPHRDGQDEIDASKAPLMEHLTELRQRLIYSLGAFFAFFVVCYAIASPIYRILTWPLRNVAPDIVMIATGLLEELFTNIKLAMFGAAFLSFPFAAYQLYKFVAPGLYKNEKQAFRPYLLWTWLLFIAGAFVVYFVVMPLLVKFAIGSQITAGADGKKPYELMPRIAEYLSLIMQLIIGFGVIFQLPVILAVLAQAGVVTAQSLKDFSRYAIVGIAAASAVLSPPDPFSMLAMMAPTVGLYYIAIWVVERIEKNRKE
jgi:sec-independent protein translocase protein TatC